MSRYWVSWTSAQYYNDHSQLPFQFWAQPSGEQDEESRLPHLVYHALIDSPSVSALWAELQRLYPDCRARFCQQKDADWQPSPKLFPSFENRTRLQPQASPITD